MQLFSMNKSRRYAFIFLVVLVGFALTFFFTLFAPVVHDAAGVIYELRAGSSKKTVIAELAERQLILHPLLFSLYVYAEPSAHLKAGEYRFAKGATAHSIWRQLTTGKGFFYHAFTIIPGWSFSQLRQSLATTTALRPLITKWSDHEIMQRLGHPELAPEGEFFPETYYYTKHSPDLVILKRAFDLMQNRLNEAWYNRDGSLPYRDAYDALIAASLIEKEAFLNAERKMIAGVLVNRLRKDMLLQFDPTVIFGLGSRYDGKIHKADLLEDNAYNTYVHKGLPPTPIAMPSMASIEAALHPAQHDYFYFVAKGDGSHQFSATLLQHHEAVTDAKQQSSGYFNQRKIRAYLPSVVGGMSP